MKGTTWRSKQSLIIFRSLYFNFDHKKRATWKFCTSMPFPFSAMEKNWINPNFPAHGSVELPVQSKWKTQACNTHAGRELRGRLHSKLLQQLNLNIKLNSLRGLITALTAAQVIPEWDITPIISIYYRIDIRYYCICHYLYQWMRVSGKLETRNLLGLRLRPLHCEEMCVCVWEALLRNSAGCWLTSWALPVPMVPTPAGWAARGASSLLTDPESLRAKGHQEVPPGDGALFSCTHMPRLWLMSQNPTRFRQTFQPNRADCRGQTVRTQRLAGEQLLLLLATSYKYCNRGAQGSFLLIPLPRPVRSMPGIPWGPGSQAEPSPSQFYYWVIKKAKSVWIAAVPFGWLTPLPLDVYCSNKSLTYLL